MLNWLLDRFRPPSVHLLADRLEAELYDAEPTSRMLDAFKREGRCDGKRSRDSSPTRRFLEDTADLVTSRIVGEFVAEDRQLTSDLEQSRQAIATAQQRQATLHSSTGDRGDDPDGAGGPSSGGSSLGHALGALAAKRAAERRRQRETRIEEADQAVEDALTRREALMGERAGLERAYQQRVESVHRAAQVLWDRYLAGHERGRGTARDDQGHQPQPELDLEMPQALLIEAQTEGVN